MKKQIAILFNITLLFGCVENFDAPQNFETKNYYSVTGILTNELPAKVLIFKTTGYNLSNLDSLSINNAEVKMYDDLENFEILQAQGNGVYIGNCPGVASRFYHLEIKLNNGDFIVSKPEKMREPTIISDLSIIQAIDYGKDYLGEQIKLDGLKVRLSLNEESENRFFKWQYNGTYITKSPLSLNYPNICYIYENLAWIDIGKSTSNDKAKLIQELFFIKPEVKYVFGYSLQITQYAISETAYNYWKDVKDQQDNVGSIFDPPPTQILGNLQLTQSDEPVLGYFEVAAITSKRIMIDSSYFKTPPAATFAACYPIDPSATPPAWCIDCSVLLNSSRIKPDFWPN